MESPYKGKTGIKRVWNALFYSLAGLRAAIRHEDAFRQEVLLALAYHPALVWLLLPFTALVALSRLVLGLHYPSDVLAGIVIGATISGLSLTTL